MSVGAAEIAKKLAKGDLVGLPTLLSKELGLDLAQVCIYCSTCNRVFVNESWADHNERVIRQLKTPNGSQEYWKYETLKHYLENRDHDIHYMGHLMGEGYINWSDYMEKRLINMPLSTVKDLLEHLRNNQVF